jgi:integrase
MLTHAPASSSEGGGRSHLCEDVNTVSQYHLKTLILSSGERFPILLGDDGRPLHLPTVFATAEVRNRHRAANTVSNVLGSLSVFHRFLKERDIDLEGRLDNGLLLDLAEIEELVRFSRKDFSRRADETSLVSAGVRATRLRNIRSYLEWISKRRLLAPDFAHAVILRERYHLTLKTISSRIPPVSQPADAREGLPPEIVERVSEIMAADSDTNPWVDEHVRVRNELIWIVLRHLGPRAGELLGLRVRHLDLRKGTLQIVRQPDIRADPRRRQPNTKTLARELEMSSALQQRLARYVITYRGELKKARRHDFLFVSNSGLPLSYSGLAKVFQILRQKHPELPQNLTAHMLRHTWNDEFSQEMDARKVDPEREKHVRSYLMGWKPTSNSAAIYTRRSVRRKAQQASLQHQRKIMGGTSDD